MKKKKKASTSTGAKKRTEEEVETGQSTEPHSTEPQSTVSQSMTATESLDGGEPDALRLQTADDDASVSDAQAWLSSDRDYTYRELLSRVFCVLRTNNPDLAGEKRKFTIVPPQVMREGSKKTAFANIADLARRMRRPLEHLTAFILTELGTIGSSDGSQRLIIKGRFQQLQIENVLRRYIVEYVTCKTCRSPDTILVKENRLFFMQCESCGSSRSVTAIKSGFKAQTERRSAQRA